MPQPTPLGRDLSILVGTSKTLERAISGLQMNSRRLAQLLTDETTTPGLETLIASLKNLTKEDQQKVDAILSHRIKPKRKK